MQKEKTHPPGTGEMDHAPIGSACKTDPKDKDRASKINMASGGLYQNVFVRIRDWRVVNHQGTVFQARGAFPSSALRASSGIHAPRSQAEPCFAPPLKTFVFTGVRNSLVIQSARGHTTRKRGDSMDWEKYKENILQKAYKQKKDDAFVSAYLSFAKRLFDQNMPVIAQPSHASALIGLKHRYVCKMAYSPKHFYRGFTIQKANGKERAIQEPLPDLKRVQRWILNEILSKADVSPYAKAYVKGRNLKHNARYHRAQKVLVTLDIKDFFPSIKIHDVYRIFEEMGYQRNVASFFAHLCCLNGVLPQGAPTSPCLSNLRMKDFDKKISRYCAENGWRYTRYADDLTFSGSRSIRDLITHVSRGVFENGFQLNPEKTRVARTNACQEVTGIVVNHHMQVPKKTRKAIRQQMYYINKYGLESHMEHIEENRSNYLRHLLGRINFALFVNPKDKELQEYAAVLKRIYHDDTIK
jgi:RNA-directed DNA polymerase